VYSNSIKLWSTTGEELATIIDQPVPYFSLAFSADGAMLAAGSVFGKITVWDVSSGEELLKSFKAHTSNVFCLAFSPDGKRLASCSDDRSVKLWDLPTGDHMITLKGHRRRVWSVGFSPDGNTLASATDGGVVNLWTAATKEEVRAVDW
jgi:WD40 repeat protein